MGKLLIIMFNIYIISLRCNWKNPLGIRKRFLIRWYKKYFTHTHTHTHTQINKHTYMLFISLSVCLCLCLSVCLSLSLSLSLSRFIIYLSILCVQRKKSKHFKMNWSANNFIFGIYVFIISYTCAHLVFWTLPLL